MPRKWTCFAQTFVAICFLVVMLAQHFEARVSTFVLLLRKWSEKYQKKMLQNGLCKCFFIVRKSANTKEIWHEQSMFSLCASQTRSLISVEAALDHVITSSVVYARSDLYTGGQCFRQWKGAGHCPWQLFDKNNILHNHQRRSTLACVRWKHGKGR